MTQLLKLMLLCGLLGAASAASASDLKATPWSSDCEGSYCVFQKTLHTVDNGSVFAIVEFVIDVETGDASIVTTAPLGVAIEPGILLEAAQAETRMIWKVCQPDGCRATVDLDSAAFASLLQQPTITIRYVPFGSDAPVAATLGMDSLITAISAASP